MTDIDKQNMRRCKNCLLPETQETITYDEQGVCSVCRNVEYKQTKIDWEDRERQFKDIIEAYRGKEQYDCIVPFSGGKDSTYTLWHLVKKYKVKPLVVSFDHGFMRPNLLENVEKTIRTLGVDYMKFRPNWHVVRKVMLEALKRKGDFCWHCHTGIFSFPMQIAIKYKIGLIIWGEPSAEYASWYSYKETEQFDERRFNRSVNLGMTAEDMAGMIGDDVDPRDLEPFRYPPLKDLKAINYRSICLGSYIPWDVKKQTAIIEEELGWKGDHVEGVPREYGYEKIECGMQGIRDYLRTIKRGYGRTAHLAAIDIRNKRLSTEDAKKLIYEHDGKRPASLDVFLRYVGIKEGEFNKIAASHVVEPNVAPDFSKIEKGKKNWDQDMWWQEIPRSEGSSAGKTGRFSSDGNKVNAEGEERRKKYGAQLRKWLLRNYNKSQEGEVQESKKE